MRLLFFLTLLNFIILNMLEALFVVVLNKLVLEEEEGEEELEEVWLCRLRLWR